MISPTLRNTGPEIVGGLDRDQRRAQRRQDLRVLGALVAVAFVASVVLAFIAGGIVATREYANDIETAEASGSIGACAGR